MPLRGDAQPNDVGMHSSICHSDSIYNAMCVLSRKIQIDYHRFWPVTLQISHRIALTRHMPYLMINFQRPNDIAASVVFRAYQQCRSHGNHANAAEKPSETNCSMV
jgi:hypothetical protein